MSEAIEQTRISGSDATIDFAAVKVKQQKTWATGNYAQVGATLQVVGEQLAESLDLRAGQRVLDVAAGNGNFSLAAARRFADVTSTDFVPALLEKGRIRALAEGFDITFQEADAEDLPYADESFDVAASVYGVMFTPNQQQAAGELIRVVKSGGKIGLANWTPEGFIGRLFQTIGHHVPNPLPSPARWGTAEHLYQLFGPAAQDMSIASRHFNFHYTSVAGWLENFKAVYGPVKNAFAVLDADGQAALQEDFLALLHELNVANDGTMKVPGEYLQVVITCA